MSGILKYFCQFQSQYSGPGPHANMLCLVLGGTLTTPAWYLRPEPDPFYARQIPPFTVKQDCRPGSDDEGDKYRLSMLMTRADCI